ncbi:hypothetical protein BCR44DRAFT_1444395, partial [Catenaria anguillulae PL171]
MPFRQSRACTWAPRASGTRAVWDSWSTFRARPVTRLWLRQSISCSVFNASDGEMGDSWPIQIGSLLAPRHTVHFFPFVTLFSTASIDLLMKIGDNG